MLQETVNSDVAGGTTSGRTSQLPARKRREGNSQLFTIVLHILLIIGAIIMASPFIWMVLTSLKDTSQAFSDPPVWIPNPFVWSNYPDSLNALPFNLAYFNSIYIAVIVVACQLVTCSMAGYAFGRINFPGRNLIFVLFLATMMIPFQLTIIPIFMTMKYLGWLDTHLSLIVPPALFSAFGVFLMRQFIMGIPHELEEAAIVDGANRWTIYIRVILPLLRAPLSALGIFSFLAQWNSFFMPLIMLNSSDKFTVPLMLNQFRGQYATEWTMVMAGSVIAVVPVLIVYILAQRYIIQGIAMTGLKS
ncbi:carbohydrate ABC transporter permease [Dictyobacter aurantiacus]|uniref:Sugar ABC transporter permease n=1 Tax=Dictyobacter aurantiacus TaxID=1936993 RepID=A0A401ZC39_9CHLR|nr:carbohydrate ABC transporter permease [Dictyobacter aurantiacus]GCE04461.1 sugar ABC transporter permease [Dictyobacter aurantiacus]